MYSLDRKNMCYNLTMPEKLYFGPPNPAMKIIVNYENLKTNDSNPSRQVDLMIAWADISLISSFYVAKQLLSPLPLYCSTVKLNWCHSQQLAGNPGPQ